MPRPRLDRPRYTLRRNRSGRYAVYWTEGGQTRSVSTGQRDEGLARIWMDRFIAGRDQPQPSLEPTIAEIRGGYAQARGQPANFLASTKPILAHLGNLTPGMISEVTINGYVRHRANRANDTIRTELKYLLAMCRWAEKVWKTTPLRFEMPLPPSPPRDRWLTKAEARLLLDATERPHTRLFILLALTTAQRSIAICDLTWDRVDFDGGLIAFGEGRGKKRRSIVPMNNQLRDALVQAYMGRTCAYVVEWAGEKVTNPRKGVSRSAERAGLGRLGKHVLRHTAATWMVMEGISEDEIARYLGTTAAMVRRVYGKHSPTYLRAASQALEF